MTKLSLYEILLESERDMYEGFNDVELSEDYPEGFDINEFKNINSYAGKMRFAEQHLGKPIGRGSARVVYRVDENKVLKLAKNKKGISQNNAETDWFNDSYYDDIHAKVIDFDDKNNIWVEMELAFRVKKSDFQRLWGIKFEDLGFYLKKRYFENRGQQSMFSVSSEVKEVMDESDEVQHLVAFMYDSDSPDGDLGRISSWGLVKREDGEYLVLIDFGLNQSTYNSYYS